MGELIRCRVCRGSKNVTSLGMMSVKCPECRGVGQIEVEEGEICDKVEENVCKSVKKRLKVQESSQK